MMQKVPGVLIIILTLSINLSHAQNNQTARKLLFDFDWKFTNEDVANAHEINVDTEDWQNIDLPHDWSIEGKIEKSNPTGNDGGYFPAGIGWYRKSFNVPADFEGKKISIYFEGVYMNAEVFINGTSLGIHPYGYTSFHFDITLFLKYGTNNTIAVKVDNSIQKNCRWYSGSGIYRHVWLQVTEPVHIKQWGVSITTPAVSKEKAGVKVETKLKNETADKQLVSLRTQVNRNETNSVVTEETKVELLPNSEKSITQEIVITNPERWSPDSPELYDAIILVISDDIVIDELSETFGIRSISYSSLTGFLLNGEHIELFGGCVHHDNGCLGAKAYDRAEERKVELLKNAGFNAVRTSHNPPSEAFLDACDRIGLLVIDESFDGWRTAKAPQAPMDYSLHFDKWWKKDIESMVLRDRNHPSIIMWSIGNEIIERTEPQAVKTAHKLATHVRKTDPTRPVTSAMTSWNQGWEIFDPLMAKHDICGYNYMLHEAHKDHDRVPSRIIFQSESYPKDVFYTWSMSNDNGFIIGDFVWTAIDYLGESGIGRTIYPGDTEGEHWERDHYPWHGAYCGDIDLLGWRKPISHYRNIVWNNTEKLYMGVREPNPVNETLKTTMWSVWPTWESWTWPGYYGKNIDVEVYSKYPKVRLYLNNKLIGEKATTRNEEFKATFTLPFEDGVLKAVGISDNQEIESVEFKTAGEAKNLKLIADRKEIKANGQDLSYVTVEVVDKNDNLQPNAVNLLKFGIEGPGEIIGTDNANLRDTESYVSNSRKAWKGRALVVIKSKQNSGEIKLTVSSEGLPDAEITIKSLQ